MIDTFTLAEVNSIFVNLPKVEPLNVFNASILICWDADEVFKADTDVFTLADVLSKLVNLPKFEALTTFNASMLICWEADDVFKAATEVFTLAEVVSIFVNLPKVEEVNEFKFDIETPTPEPTFAITSANDAETEPLYVVYPSTCVKSICWEAVTKLSPPINATLLSAPNAPAFQ